jgi:hypothetical protein
MHTHASVTDTYGRLHPRQVQSNQFTSRARISFFASAAASCTRPCGSGNRQAFRSSQGNPWSNEGSNCASLHGLCLLGLCVNVIDCYWSRSDQGCFAKRDVPTVPFSDTDTKRRHARNYRTRMCRMHSAVQGITAL